jgi:hypothetical protein
VKIVYQKHFSTQDCNDNPHRLYVFGDNLQRRGRGGQAVIRDCDNAVGLATKHFPTMNDNAFFSSIDKQTVLKEIQDVKDAMIIGEYEELVLPSDGLGTGRAMMKEKCPDLLDIINKEFYECN